MTLKKAFTSIALAALTLSAASATELFKPILLPDLGNGSLARGLIYWGNGETVVGEVYTGGVGQLPYLWDLDNDGQVIGSTQLPLPAGFRGGCSQGDIFADGQMAVVGTIRTPSGTPHAVIWRKMPMGTWSMPVMLAPGTDSSQVSNDPNAACGDSIMAEWHTALSFTDDGTADTHTAVVTITPTGASLKELPRLGNRSAMALGVTDDEGASTDPTLVVGWATAPNGMRKPVAWDLNNDGNYTLRALSVPQGVAGRGRGLAIDEGLWYAVGEVTRNGRTQAYGWDLNNDGALMSPLEGYMHSTAYNLGDTGTHEIGHWAFGQSYNANGLPAATGWLNNAPVDVSRLMVDISMLPGTIVAFGWDLDNDGLFAPGQVVPTPGAPPQAAVFMVTDNNVPAITGIDGQVWDDTDVVWALWHDDDNELRVRTRQRRATVDLVFTPLSRRRNGEQWYYDYSYLMRAERNSPGASGTVEVLSFCQTHQQWDSLASFATSDENTGSMISVQEGSHTYHDTTTGATRVRLRFTQNGNQPTTLVTDEFGLHMH